MPNIVECPICDSRFDVSKLPDGSKIKCSKCKKVVGKLVGGALIPILEAVKKAPVQQRRPVRYVNEDDYEEVIVRRRVPHGAAPDEAYPPVKEKQDIFLTVAGLVGFFAIVTLVYALFKSAQPVMPVGWGKMPATYATTTAPATTPPPAPTTK